MTLSPQMAMTIDTEKLLSLSSGHLTPLPPSVNLQEPAKFGRISSQEDGSTPKQLPGAWGTLASGDLYEKLSSLAAQQGPEDICMEFPKPIFAAEEVVKVPLQSVTPPPAPHAVLRVTREARRNRPAAVISKGSVGHPYTCAGACKYVKRKGGCRDGAECPNCHECFWSKATAKVAETRNDLPLGQEEPLAEKMMRLLQEESKKAALSAPQTGLFGEWSSDVNYMGVSIPGPLMPVHTAENPGSTGHPYSCGPACKYVLKARGCKDGDLCTHCHLCRWTRYASKHHVKL